MLTEDLSQFCKPDETATEIKHQKMAKLRVFIFDQTSFTEQETQSVNGF